MNSTDIKIEDIHARSEYLETEFFTNTKKPTKVSNSTQKSPQIPNSTLKPPKTSNSSNQLKTSISSISAVINKPEQINIVGRTKSILVFSCPFDTFSGEKPAMFYHFASCHSELEQNLLKFIRANK
jgi:hypothetical protein